LAYANGRGVSQSYAEAATWYRKAAEQGYARAQSNLGTLYSNGQGVPQDYLLAYMWFTVAGSRLSEADRATADKGRDLAAAKLTPAELRRAQQMARDWEPAAK